MQDGPVLAKGRAPLPHYSRLPHPFCQGCCLIRPFVCSEACSEDGAGCLPYSVVPSDQRTVAVECDDLGHRIKL